MWQTAGALSCPLARRRAPGPASAGGRRGVRQVWASTASAPGRRAREAPAGPGAVRLRYRGPSGAARTVQDPNRPLLPVKDEIRRLSIPRACGLPSTGAASAPRRAARRPSSSWHENGATRAPAGRSGAFPGSRGREESTRPARAAPAPQNGPQWVPLAAWACAGRPGSSSSPACAHAAARSYVALLRCPFRERLPAPGPALRRPGRATISCGCSRSRDESGGRCVRQFAGSLSIVCFRA